jgi:large subunit ribosomal protein L21
MYAIIQSGSKQYRVKKDDVIHVELLEAEPGQQVEFRDVLFVGGEDGKAEVGMPTVAGCVVKGQYLAVAKGPKVVSIKYKRRKNNYRKFGHRQKYAEIKIIDIVK